MLVKRIFFQILPPNPILEIPKPFIQLPMSIALTNRVKDLTKPAALINLNRIKSEETRDYLLRNRLKDTSDLSNILPICYLEGITNDFHSHIKSYDFPFDVEKVWDAYVNIPPIIAWGGRRIGFSFAYNPSSGVFHYEDDAYKGLREGQLIFIVIKVFFGLFKMAVTHQVNKIDEETKTIKLCYVEGGKSAGSQILRFEDLGNNHTRVIHETYYKSASDFRDRKLYPLLHERIINQLHRNILRYLSC